MTDFYFIYSIIDLIWKVFSILFILYRFTSFFSMLYEFFKFSGKLLKGFIYIKDQITIYIKKRNNYSFDDSDLPIRPKSFFSKLCDKIFKRNVSDNTYLPLYETRTECINNNFRESRTDTFNFKNSIQNEEFNSLLNANVRNPESSNNFISDIFNSHQYSDLYYDINTSTSSISIYPQTKTEIKQSFNNNQDSFNLLKSEFISNILKTNENEEN